MNKGNERRFNMYIRVTEDFDVIYEGDADEFLEINFYEEELEACLNELEAYKKNSVTYGGGAMPTYTIEQVEYSFWED